jgi:uncharacterized protein (TIGR03067 family)
MQRWNIVLFVVALFSLSLIGLSLAEDDAAKELAKFQGNWIMLSGEVGGNKVADEHVKRSSIKFEGTKGELVAPHQAAETIFFDIVKLDPAKNPKEMHFVRKTGPSAGKTIVGIYEFEGPDQYKFALDPTGAVSLKEFDTKKGTGHIRQTWKRVKP